MRRVSATSLMLLLLLAIVLADFWRLEQTTPERIASLIFFILIGSYTLVTRRNDVLGASVSFFLALNLNHYLFEQVLTLWQASLVFIGLIFILWRLLFGRTGWFLAIASVLGVIEMSLAVQFTNLDLTWQALLIVAPFIIISQHYYFSQNQLDAS
jgi:hypothetical protein